jgi:phosphatidyl-myo-inositol dimannoside synthase
MPDKLENDASGLSGNFAYLRALLRQVRRTEFDLIYCGHVNLIPLARLASRLSGAPWVLCIYGVEAWKPMERRLSRTGLQHADGVISLSQLTLDRLLGWCPIDPAKCIVVPNAVHLEQFSPQPKDPGLLAGYGLAGHTTIMTLGRLDPTEQAKGFDRTIAILPEIAKDVPDIKYLIVGKGGDKPHLEALAAQHGVSDRVIFAGFVAEEDKAAHYNLADAYVMPSVGEGFGFVFIEALACGVPVVASDLDGGREAVLEGELGLVIDPFDKPALRQAILDALKTPKGVPERLSYFSFANFTERTNAALQRFMVG